MSQYPHLHLDEQKRFRMKKLKRRAAEILRDHGYLNAKGFYNPPLPEEIESILWETYEQGGYAKLEQAVLATAILIGLEKPRIGSWGVKERYRVGFTAPRGTYGRNGA